jgi:osmotically-inducible protein OsmY
VGSTTHATPSDVADRIGKAFKRSAIVDDSNVVVTNDGHTVTLTGMVGSYGAMREAVDTHGRPPASTGSSTTSSSGP